jgi:cytochrome c-type biogenesis protein
VSLSATQLAVAFAAGVVSIFTLAGAGAGILGSQFLEHRRGLELIGGVIVIAMGIVMLAPRWITFLQRQARLPMQFGHDGALWAGLAGAAFAIGWTPCIGPTLGTILTVAGTEGRATDGAVLLFAYSLGLGLPFLAAGIWLSSVLAATRPLRQHWELVTRGFGAVLVFVGVLLATGQLAEISARLGS